MLAIVFALLLQSADTPAPPADLGATGPRMDRGFGKHYCGVHHIPVTMYGPGTWGIWTSAPSLREQVANGEFTVGIDQKPGTIWPDMRAVALRFSVTLAPGVAVDRTRLHLDGRKSKLGFRLRRFNDPAALWLEVEGTTDDTYEQVGSEIVMKPLLAASTAEFRFYDKKGKQVARTAWDVSRLRWMPVALERAGFSCPWN